MALIARGSGCWWRLWFCVVGLLAPSRLSQSMLGDILWEVTATFLLRNGIQLKLSLLAEINYNFILQKLFLLTCSCFRFVHLLCLSVCLSVPSVILIFNLICILIYFILIFISCHPTDQSITVFTPTSYSFISKQNSGMWFIMEYKMKKF